MESIGFIGAALLAMCAFPQAIKSYVDGITAGISISFLWTWYIGEILMLYYTYETLPIGPLFLNYAVNVFLLTVILHFHYFPRRDNG